jgi:hypothetical protein
MASIISAGTTSGTALNMSGDTSGILQLASNGTTTAVTIDTSQNVGIGTTSPSTLVDLAKSNTSGNDNQMPNLFVRNTSATQGNGSSTFNQSIVGVSAGNSTVSGGIRAAYDSAGSYGTGVQFYVNSTNPLQFYTNGSERMRINSAGSLLLAQTAVILTGTIQFTFDGQNQQGMCIKNSANSTNGAALRFIDYTNAYTGGGIYFQSSNSINYATSSDYRLKENIAPMTGALTKIQQLKPVTFSWKQDNSVSQGFIAHELQAVIPQAVNGTKDAVDKDGNPMYQGVDTSYIVATLTAAMQELKAINDTQAATITALTARIVALETV